MKQLGPILKSLNLNLDFFLNNPSLENNLLKNLKVF